MMVNKRYFKGHLLIIVRKFNKLLLKLKYYKTEYKFSYLKKGQTLKVATLKEMAAIYKAYKKYDKEKACLAAILEQQPENMQALYGMATINSRLGFWDDSIEGFKKVLVNLEQEDSPFSVNNERLFLAASKKVIHAFLIQNNAEACINRRLAIYERLGGPKDVSEIYKIHYGKTPAIIKTDMFRAGLSGFYICTHYPNGKFEPFLEKCCKPGSNEPEIYKAISNYRLFEKNSTMKVPDLKGSIERANYIKLFLSYVDGITLNKSNVNGVVCYNLGFILGEIGRSFDKVFEERGVKLRPLKNFKVKEVINYFSRQEYDEVKKYWQILDGFFGQRKELIAARNKLPTLFAHNDLGLQNILLNKNNEYVVLDWEHAGFNTAGSDIGHVLSSKKFEKAEEKGIINEFEKKMIEGYLNSINKNHPYVSKDEIIVSYNLQFINAKLNGALRRHDFKLFKRIARRCELVRKMLDL